MPASRRASSAAARAVGVALLAATAAAVLLGAQADNPRFGKWKLRQEAPPPAFNIMTYEPAGQGMKVTVDSLSADGRKGHWTYTTMLDGRDVPITGHPTADAASLRVVDDRVNEIVYKKAGVATQFLTNVLSADGRTLTVSFKNPEGRTTAVAVYEKMP